jgi:hypothetical protein
MRGAAHGVLVEQLSACMYPCWKVDLEHCADQPQRKNGVVEVSSAPSSNQE